MILKSLLDRCNKAEFSPSAAKTEIKYMIRTPQSKESLRGRQYEQNGV